MQKSSSDTSSIVPEQGTEYLVAPDQAGSRLLLELNTGREEESPKEGSRGERGKPSATSRTCPPVQALARTWTHSKAQCRLQVPLQ